MLNPLQLSDLVHAIYACAIEPQRWPDTLRRIADATGCAKAAIVITALDGTETRVYQQHGVAPEWWARFQSAYSLDAARYFSAAMARPDVDIDAPFVLSRLMPREAIDAMPVVREWAAPQGLTDNMSAIVLATASRVASVDLMRGNGGGQMRDGDIEVFRLLIPHLRRSIKISDLIDSEAIGAGSVHAVLDAVAFGVVIVGDGAEVLAVNAAARVLLDRRTPIHEDSGRLAGNTAAITRRLREAIAGARAVGSGVRIDSLGLPLAGDGAVPVLAHVLPLSMSRTGDGRHDRAHPAAAVIIAGAGAPAPAVLKTIARAYGLTETEQRMLVAVAAGNGVPEAAAALGMQVATGRTHMKRVFAKLGVGKHAELVALLNRLAPAVRDGAEIA